MTYCIAIRIDAGLCFVSDSRTNAGVDNISTYSKMFTFTDEGERQITVLSSGNLATTQGVIGQLKRDIKQSASINLKNKLNMTPLTVAAYLARQEMFFHIANIEREVYWQIGEQV